MGKNKFKRRKINQLWQGIKELKETMLKLINIQNEKLDKLTKITQNLENSLYGIQKTMVEHENKLNQLEQEKENHAIRWFRKQICLSFNLTGKINT